MGRVFLTGDTHGVFYRLADFCDKNKTSKEDVIIILGDAGLNYYGCHGDHSCKSYVNNLPITVFAIHGNHEMRPETIKSYKEKKWNGGTVYVEDEFPSILFAKDGEVYNLNEKRVLAIGGAYSVDKWHRILRGMSWWADEQPSDEIKQRTEHKLESLAWDIDVVISHTVPLKYEPVEAFLPQVDQSEVDKSTEIWLNEIEEKLKYNQWYAGHYHIKKQIDKLRIMYEDYAEL